MSSSQSTSLIDECDRAPLRRIVGVLGGMGPLATIDFMQKVLTHTPSKTDQDHVAIIVASIPQIPDRTAAFKGKGTSPLEALICSGLRLVYAGAKLIVMPCNTAHLWYEELRRVLQTPMLHIVDTALADVVSRLGREAPVGLLATSATIESGIYIRRAAGSSTTRDLRWVLPTSNELDDWIAPAISAVKAGRIEEATPRLLQAARALQDRGARCIVMGCTEIPLALFPRDLSISLVDATDTLARGTVEWAKRGEFERL